MGTDWREVLASASEQMHNARKITDLDLKPGLVVYMPLRREDGLVISEPYNSRKKFFVVLGITEDGKVIGAVLINSKPNNRSEEEMLGQYPLKKADYPEFLTKPTSYIDCTDLFEFDKQRVIDEGEKQVQLTDSDISLVLQTVHDSPLVSNKQKKRFGI